MNSYHVRIIIQRLSEHQSNLSIVIARINTTHSCNDDGNTQGEFISNSSIHNTFNKGITIHGTNDVDLDNNVVFDHIGHGIFLEDGNEIRTEVTNNLVFVTRRAPNGASVPSDVSDPSSYWIEHPNNTFTGNTAAGSAEVGFWLFGNNAPHGDSAGQPIPLVTGVIWCSTTTQRTLQSRRTSSKAPSEPMDQSRAARSVVHRRHLSFE